ncbi:MAG: ribose-phosphate diphosphokinase [Gammaproteobacteria bacterium]
MNLEGIRLFALNASRAYGEKIAGRLGMSLSAHEERDFEDGEHKSRPLVNVRGRDVYVIQSLYGDEKDSVNDKLCRLLFFAATLRDASAARITVIVPYLCYARKDRKTQPRDPVTTRYVASLIEAVGVDRLVTLDAHNVAALQNAFRCPVDHLEARKLFVAFFGERLRDEEIAVISPDTGGIKRAEQFRKSLGQSLNRSIATAFVEKHRAHGIVSGDAIVGDVRDKVAIIIDDLISTGNTILRAAQACRHWGAKSVYAAASHGVFVGEANKVIADRSLEQVVVTDTIPPFRLDPETVEQKLVVLDAAFLFAESIKRLHTGGSIVELLEI